MSNRHFYLGAAVVTAITLACRHAGQVCGLGLEGSFLDGYWVMFASGVLLHYLLNRAGSTGRVIGGAVLVLGMAYAVADRLFWADNAGERHMASYIFVGCGFGLALAWLRRFDAAWSKAMWAKPFFWCGQRSYSIYLAHYPVVVTLSCALHLAGMETPWEWLLVVMPTCLAASLVSGWLFYQLVERHFLNLAPLKAAKPLVNIPLALVDRGVTVAEPTRADLSS
jgi:peptidoglycan/LPS O-acetylase OafA/YrhL